MNVTLLDASSQEDADLQNYINSLFYTLKQKNVEVKHFSLSEILHWMLGLLVENTRCMCAQRRYGAHISRNCSFRLVDFCFSVYCRLCK